MRRNISRVAAFAALSLCAIGCDLGPEARYVYQDGEYGVIGMQRNSPLGRKDFRAEAEYLMALHFPEGYEIVRAEEVVEGERVFQAARKLELDSEPGIMALNQMLKLGKVAKSTAIDQKDTVHITESRIIYRRKPGGQADGHDGFAAVATLTPEFYLDPNTTLRKMAAESNQLAKKDAPAGGPRPDEAKPALAKADDKEAKAPDKKDPEVQKASMPFSK
ncbi:hypothetical protein P12x_002972 [Tundrisphaera lichenicola]|uniref:hypothetical protein n=1 Tax=Tundrisphaera lichenicola TaxID=2029860 RepID=UPI003EBCB097